MAAFMWLGTSIQIIRFYRISAGFSKRRGRVSGKPADLMRGGQRLLWSLEEPHFFNQARNLLPALIVLFGFVRRHPDVGRRLQGLCLLLVQPFNLPLYLLKDIYG